MVVVTVINASLFVILKEKNLIFSAESQMLDENIFSWWDSDYSWTEFGKIRVGNCTKNLIFTLKLPRTSFSLL